MNQYRCIVVECCGKCIHSAYRSPTEQFCNREKPHWTLRLDQWADGISSCCTLPYQSDRDKVLTQRNIKALKRIIGFAFSYKQDLSEESQEDIKIADDLYHKLKAELRQAGEP
jgi:hypothetical protein